MTAIKLCIYSMKMISCLVMVRQASKPGKQKEKHWNWGGKRSPSPGKALGRPSVGGGRSISIRLNPWLIVELGLKKAGDVYGRDSRRLHDLIDKAYEFLLANPSKSEAGRKYHDIYPQRAPYGIKRQGWSDGKTAMAVWLSNSELNKLAKLGKSKKATTT